MPLRWLLVPLLVFLLDMPLAHAVRPNLGSSDDGSNQATTGNENNCTDSTPNLVVLPTFGSSPSNTCNANGQAGGSPIVITGSNFRVTLTPALISNGGGNPFTLFDVSFIATSSNAPVLHLSSILLGLIPSTSSGGVNVVDVDYFACSVGTGVYPPSSVPAQPFCMGANTSNLLELTYLPTNATFPQTFAYDPSVIVNGSANTVKWDINCATAAANVAVDCAVLAVAGIPNDVSNTISGGTLQAGTTNGIYLGSLPVTVTVQSNGTLATASNSNGPLPPSAPAATNALLANAVAISSANFTTTADVTASFPQELLSPSGSTLAGSMTPAPAFTFPASVPATTAPCSGNVPSVGADYTNYYRAAWYTITPAAASTITADTKGSSYDTRIFVFTGDPVNSPAAVKMMVCDDDLPPVSTFDPRQLQAMVSFQAAAGTTYYIMVSEAPGAVATSANNSQLAATPLSSDAVLKLSVVTTPLPIAATPTFSVAAGDYPSAQTVVISDSTSGATIYYSTNGSTATTSSTKYTGPISVSATETINAIAVASGFAQSNVATAAYGIGPLSATPSFSVPAGTYTSVQTDALSDSTPGAVIYYTTDGSTPTTNSAQYTTSITVGASETINAIATASGHSPSAVATAAYTITLPVATPTFSPVAGTYTSVQTVTISDSSPGATIYYAINGAATTSSTSYTSPITVGASETINAIAVATGYTQSAVGTAAYTINLPAAATPTFSPGAGTYTSIQTVTISDTTPGAAIYYTTDGSTPTPSSPRYSSAITVSSSAAIKAIATATGYSASNVATAAFTITLPAATPTFSPAAGTYTSTQTVTISDTTPGATIYYTTNGSAPTAGSTPYTGAITVSTSETVNAIAVATSYAQSSTGTAAYTINLPASFQVSVNPSTITMVAGQNGTAIFTVTPQNGFNSSVNLASTGLPSEATCSFSPAFLTPNGAAVISTLTVATTAPSAAVEMPFGNPRAPLYAILFPGLLTMLGFAAGQRRMLRGTQLCAVLALLVLFAGITACGGGGGSQATSSNPGTPVGSYTISVSATSAGGNGPSNGPATLTVIITH